MSILDKAMIAAVAVGNPVAAIIYARDGDWLTVLWVVIATGWFALYMLTELKAHTRTVRTITMLLPPGESLNGLDEGELANRIADAMRGGPHERRL